VAQPPCLVLFARSPAPGTVKTRLVPPLSAEEAARLYRAFLEDAARAYVFPGRWECVLDAHPEPDTPALSALFGSPWRREKQGAGGLGERLAAAFEREFSRGAPAVVAVGSDHPALSRRLLAECFGALVEGFDASVVPAEDGGYCAIGLAPHVPVRRVFDGVPWSSPSVLEATRERMRAAGLRLAELETAYDVDRPEDLRRLRLDLASRDPESPDYPRATARAMATLPAEGPP
jgi:rSAM/selenodomain-associated transferase 1